MVEGHYISATVTSGAKGCQQMKKELGNKVGEIGIFLAKAFRMPEQINRVSCCIGIFLICKFHLR